MRLPLSLARRIYHDLRIRRGLAQFRGPNASGVAQRNLIFLLNLGHRNVRLKTPLPTGFHRVSLPATAFLLAGLKYEKLFHFSPSPEISKSRPPVTMTCFVCTTQESNSRAGVRAPASARWTGPDACRSPKAESVSLIEVLQQLIANENRRRSVDRTDCERPSGMRQSSLPSGTVGEHGES